MARMLVVDDEERICRFLGRALRSAGYEVASAATGAEALRAVQQYDYDLIVLDLMLPGVHGREVLRRILADRPDRRVLVLSALSGVETRVGCLEAGAVDFVPKPFALAELLARIRSRLQQPVGPRPGVPDMTSATLPSGVEEFRVGDVRVDTRRRQLDLNGERRQLTHREFVLLLHLMLRAGQVCTREELLTEVWGYTFDPGSNIVDVYIGRLRAKLEPGQVETVRNVGYCFLPNRSKAPDEAAAAK